MAKMSTLDLEIKIMLERGSHPTFVCKVLGCSLFQVYDVQATLAQADPCATLES